MLIDCPRCGGYPPAGSCPVCDAARQIDVVQEQAVIVDGTGAEWVCIERRHGDRVFQRFMVLAAYLEPVANEREVWVDGERLLEGETLRVVIDDGARAGGIDVDVPAEVVTDADGGFRVHLGPT